MATNFFRVPWRRGGRPVAPTTPIDLRQSSWSLVCRNEGGTAAFRSPVTRGSEDVVKVTGSRVKAGIIAPLLGPDKFVDNVHHRVKEEPPLVYDLPIEEIISKDGKDPDSE
jgi:hypothetical protein